MHELIHDSFYDILKEYDRLEVDYCLIVNSSPNQGYLSHKEAVLYAMNKLRQQYSWISIDEAKLTVKESSPEKLFSVPESPWKESGRGTTLYNINYPESGKIPYWYAFLEPPHGTGPVTKNGKLLRKKYGREDFEIINRALFPQGTDELEVYGWSTDWSTYFDAGHEWWGTLCYSIYDKKLDRYVVLIASATD